MAQANKLKFFVGVLLAIFCVVSAAEKRTFAEINFAQKFLKQYHYLSPLKNGNHDWKTALEIYQRLMNLPVTGQLDNDTITEMRKPRCGVPDIEEDKNTGIVKRFGVSAMKWTTNKLTYGFVNYCQDLSRSLCESVIAKAFKLWSDNSVLTFTKLSDNTKADIKISFVKGKHQSCPFDFDGPGNVLAHAQFPTQGGIHFDEDETFTDGTRSGTNLYSVAVHEIGHVIGISHQTAIKSAVMYTTYKGYNPSRPLKLHADDINAVAYLYGGSTVKPAITQAKSCADQSTSCMRFKPSCSSSQYIASNCPDTCGKCKNELCKDKWQKSWCNYYKSINQCHSGRVSPNCIETCHIPC